MEEEKFDTLNCANKWQIFKLFQHSKSPERKQSEEMQQTGN